jgi:large subunit ribosomal protein L7/L12
MCGTVQARVTHEKYFAYTPQQPTHQTPDGVNMPDDQPKTLTCPACGAPLEFDGKSAIVRCKFCRNVSIVPGFQPSRAAAPDLALAEIRRLAESGDKIEAIRRYREAYGVGLKEAKQAVEALQAGRLAERAEDPSALESADLDKVLSEIRTLLESGNKIEAIRKYREAYDVSLTRAKYAVEQIEAGREITFQGPAVRERPVEQTGSRLSCAIGTGILLLIVGIVVFALAQPGGPFVPRLLPNGPAALLPSEGDAPPDVVATLYNPDEKYHVIGRIDSIHGKLLWKSDPLPESGTMGAIVQGDDLVFVAHGTDLVAFHKTDGSPAWQAPMSDMVYIEDSLAFSDGRVIAMGLDQMLQVYDAATGRLLWRRQIGGYDRVIRQIDGSLLSIDYVDDANHFGMIFLDPADGSVQRTLTPRCRSDDHSSDSINPNSGLMYDQTEGVFYLIYGFFTGCIQRVDAASGRAAWETTNDDAFSFSPDGFHPLNTRTALYFGSGNRLVAVDKSGGEVKILLDDKDYEFLPLVVDGDLLIVRARRARGTERFELWGVDRASGKRTWQIDLGKAKPLDPPNNLVGLVDSDDHGWTWRLVPGGLALIEFQAEPNQVVLKTIDTAKGNTLDEKTLPLKKVSGDFYLVPKLIGWQGQTAFFNVEISLYVIDISTGKIKLAY